MSELEGPISGRPPGESGQEEPARLGPFGRFTGTLFSPGETFEDVNRKPTWLAPIIISIVTVVISTLFVDWRVSPDWDRISRDRIRRQVEKTGRSMPSEEQMQAQVRLAKTIGKFIPIIAAVSTPIVMVILAGVFALGLMLIQTQATFKKILSVVAWTGCATGAVSSIVVIASLMLRDSESLKQIDPTQAGGLSATNLAVFLSSSTAAPIRSIAASLDIFSIWFLILLSIGFAAIAGSRKIKTRKTGALVFGLWAIWVLIKAGFASLGFGG